ncbi:MAG: hypothetical protein V3R65_08655 [Acidiferrobacterales bacterium]
MDVQCYAHRLLNPFRGSVNYIRFKSAEAVTLDGVTWDIYVANEALRKGLDTNKRVMTSDVRYGKWSAEHGLKRGPICPSDDFQYLENMGAVVYESLLDLREKIPFPFTDRLELWLLDPDDRPLALIHSVSDEQDIEPDIAIDWRAGNACRKSFNSDAMKEIDQGNNDLCSGEYLTNYINQCAGRSPYAQWIRRRNDGSGEALELDNRSGLSGRCLTANELPALMLDCENHDAAHQKLIHDFFTWQAPWLLSLQSLDDEERAHFEVCARSRAGVVEQQHRLYPRIIDKTAIQTARVEAMLRKDQPTSDTRDEVLSAFYTEMGATGG